MASDASVNPSLFKIFERMGGKFVTPPEALQKKFLRIRALVFDWDGVFNAGEKGESVTSHFTEPDSMGSNMLRFGLWMPQKKMPVVAVITGVDNRSAMHLARREHFQAVYSGIQRKRLALEHLCAAHGLRPEQIAYLYDDINDLDVAARCGVRILVDRAASPMFRYYVMIKKLADYVTGSTAGRYGVREAAELMLALLGRYVEAVDARVAWDRDYQTYLTERQSILTQFYTQRGEKIQFKGGGT
jgi:3-deoxy-D-manno-octulosonate 8-phosphate phosphatase (KDO 8-P phosphatase)